MGFDHVLAAPVFATGAAGDIFLTADHERVHPALAPSQSADDFLTDLATECREYGLHLLLDVVLGRVAADAALVNAKATWFHPAEETSRVDPRTSLRQPDAAYARFDTAGVGNDVTDWWIDRLQRLARAGVAGFRCEQPQLVPPAKWRRIISAVQKTFPECRFMAWTPGLDWRDIAALREVGFAATFSSTPWWDGRAPWFVEEHELLRGIGTVIGCPEAPFGPRLARRLANSLDPIAEYRHVLRRAAATGTGLLVPMGAEYASTVDMDRRGGVIDDLTMHPSRCTAALAAEIRNANALTDQIAALGIDGEMRLCADPEQPVTALLRADAADVRLGRSFIVVLINSDLRRDHSLPISLDPLPPASGVAAIAHETISGERDGRGALAGGEIRIVTAQASSRIKLRRSESQLGKLAASPAIAIDNVVPIVAGGRFAAKRIVGEPVIVEADIFTAGHEVLAADLLWRAADQSDWHRAPMQTLANDRWRVTLAPDRIGRHEFTLEAWVDRYGTLCRDLDVKRKAAADVSVEIMEGRTLLEQARERTPADERKIIGTALHWLADASSDASVEILLTPDLREVMRNAEDNRFRFRREPPMAIEVERPQAGFGAWYEMFPRSATDSAQRHGTFIDLIDRLPTIRNMGFDVLYLPPIHPIGTTNRKGKNNDLKVEPGDVGSPYAIGSSEGGHEAIHPALGTIEDFRRLREAAAAHGLELALDFAIQCSPDHPWLKEHPEWFNWRPDGTVRYAENPPKKYEDIVNVDFFAPDAYPNLWNALRDVVLYWVDEGVRIFRVDNPHTKPLPFWEWLIAQVRGRHPDVIFLSEAFTRPKMMYRLAKVGFSQSYTYFTWRNTKHELTDYFVELTTTDVTEYFRPQLFVNTPDINPYFLQTSGRPGFLIRAALATTLSGLWGMYSGFELCEAAALPGREEYLDSEKYEIRVRHPEAPGNIIAEIAKLNRIRRSNPALQTHLGLRFYPAYNDQVLLYGKMLHPGGAMILVAVSLDPFRAQEVTIEVPLWEWNLPDSASVSVRDLMREIPFVWHGKLQRLRLDPADMPFAIWRVAPGTGG